MMNFWLLIFCMGSALAGVFVYHVISKIAVQKKMALRVHRAITGEKNARESLLRHGFKIEGEQVTKQGELWVNGVRKQFTIRADFIVQKKGRTAVVDAKSGEKAADPCNPDTRRRMFEYFYCYGVQDVYIFNDVCKQLVRIDFPKTVAPAVLPARSFITGLLTGFFVMLIALIILRMV